MTATEICHEAFAPLTFFAFALGACIGSFLNVVIWRLPRGESLSTPPSHCPNCNHAIRPWENIPIISWLFLRARCSSCKMPISVRYPAIELLTAMVFLCLWLRVVATGVSPAALPSQFFLAGALIAATFTDCERRVIPNKITYSGIVFGLLAALFLPAGHGLVFSGRLHPGEGYFVAEWLFSWLSLPAITPRLIPFADSAAGVILAVAGLWAIRVLAGSVVGVSKPADVAGQRVLVDADGLRVGGQRILTWPEAISCTLRVRNPQLEGAGEALAGPPGGAAAETTFVVRRGRLEFGSRRLDLDDLNALRGEIVEIKIMRDVLGWGDIKLIAMIGALLGAEALPFILAIASGFGLVAGIGLRLVSASCRRQGVPFAPFLAAACAVWLFLGNPVDWVVGGGVAQPFAPTADMTRELDVAGRPPANSPGEPFVETMTSRPEARRCPDGRRS